MCGEHPVLNVHAGVQRQLVHLSKNDGRIRRLLGVASHHHRPARIQCPVKVVMPAMHIERLFCERPRANLQHHCRELARRVVILLHRIGDALPGSEIHRPLARYCKRRRPALRRMLTLTLDGNLLVPPNIQLPLGKRLLI